MLYHEGDDLRRDPVPEEVCKPMCDTLILHDNSGKPLVFGKNSDRHPEEPQALVYCAPREPGSAKLRESIEYPDRGYAFLLSKPSWMSGGEMGINSQGLAIGNEAVFSRFKAEPSGVLGMDILRAALASCAGAKDAVDFITSFIEQHAQGGNGALKGTLVYSNSFLAVDPEEAYVIETAGTRWAWRKAMVADAISNAYCIEDDYKRLDNQTRKEIAPVNERAACSDEADPGRKGARNSWKKHVEDRKYLLVTKGELRRSTSLAGLMRAAALASGGGLSAPAQSSAEAALASMLSILRSHEGGAKPGSLFGGMKNICMHAGLYPKSSTTASMSVEYLPGGAIVWHTGSPHPCVSLYKPTILWGGRFYSIWKPLAAESKAEPVFGYWQTRAAWAQRHGALARSGQNDFVASRDEAQKSIIAIARQAFDALSNEKAPPERILSVYASEVSAIVGEWEDRWAE